MHAYILEFSLTGLTVPLAPERKCDSVQAPLGVACLRKPHAKINAR
jgi:hypothetical protein